MAEEKKISRKVLDSLVSGFVDDEHKKAAENLVKSIFGKATSANEDDVRELKAELFAASTEGRRPNLDPRIRESIRIKIAQAAPEAEAPAQPDAAQGAAQMPALNARPAPSLAAFAPAEQERQYTHPAPRPGGNPSPDTIKKAAEQHAQQVYPKPEQGGAPAASTGLPVFAGVGKPGAPPPRATGAIGRSNDGTNIFPADESASDAGLDSLDLGSLLGGTEPPAASAPAAPKPAQSSPASDVSTNLADMLGAGQDSKPKPAPAPQPAPASSSPDGSQDWADVLARALGAGQDSKPKPDPAPQPASVPASAPEPAPAVDSEGKTPPQGLPAVGTGKVKLTPQYINHLLETLSLTPETAARHSLGPQLKEKDRKARETLVKAMVSSLVNAGYTSLDTAQLKQLEDYGLNISAGKTHDESVKGHDMLNDALVRGRGGKAHVRDSKTAEVVGEVGDSHVIKALDEDTFLKNVADSIKSRSPGASPNRVAELAKELACGIYIPSNVGVVADRVVDVIAREKEEDAKIRDLSSIMPMPPAFEEKEADADATLTLENAVKYARESHLLVSQKVDYAIREIKIIGEKRKKEKRAKGQGILARISNLFGRKQEAKPAEPSEDEKIFADMEAQIKGKSPEIKAKESAPADQGQVKRKISERWADTLVDDFVKGVIESRKVQTKTVNGENCVRKGDITDAFKAEVQERADQLKDPQYIEGKNAKETRKEGWEESVLIKLEGVNPLNPGHYITDSVKLYKSIESIGGLSGANRKKGEKRLLTNVFNDLKEDFDYEAAVLLVKYAIKLNEDGAVAYPEEIKKIVAEAKAKKKKQAKAAKAEEREKTGGFLRRLLKRNKKESAAPEPYKPKYLLEKESLDAGCVATINELFEEQGKGAFAGSTALSPNEMKSNYYEFYAAIPRATPKFNQQGEVIGIQFSVAENDNYLNTIVLERDDGSNPDGTSKPPKSLPKNADTIRSLGGTSGIEHSVSQRIAEELKGIIESDQNSTRKLNPKVKEHISRLAESVNSNHPEHSALIKNICMMYSEAVSGLKFNANPATGEMKDVIKLGKSGEPSYAMSILEEAIFDIYRKIMLPSELFGERSTFLSSASIRISDVQQAVEAAGVAADKTSTSATLISPAPARKDKVLVNIDMDYLIGECSGNSAEPEYRNLVRDTILAALQGKVKDKGGFVFNLKQHESSENIYLIEESELADNVNALKRLCLDRCPPKHKKSTQPIIVPDEVEIPGQFKRNFPVENEYQQRELEEVVNDEFGTFPEDEGASTTGAIPVALIIKLAEERGFYVDEQGQKFVKGEGLYAAALKEGKWFRREEKAKSIRDRIAKLTDENHKLKKQLAVIQGDLSNKDNWVEMADMLIHFYPSDPKYKAALSSAKGVMGMYAVAMSWQAEEIKTLHGQLLAVSTKAQHYDEIMKELDYLRTEHDELEKSSDQKVLVSMSQLESMTSATNEAKDAAVVAAKSAEKAAHHAERAAAARSSGRMGWGRKIFYAAAASILAYAGWTYVKPIAESYIDERRVEELVLAHEACKLKEQAKSAVKAYDQAIEDFRMRASGNQAPK